MVHKYSKEPENPSKSAKVRGWQQGCTLMEGEVAQDQMHVCVGSHDARSLTFSKGGNWTRACIALAPTPSLAFHTQARGSDLRVHFKNTREHNSLVWGVVVPQPCWAGNRRLPCTHPCTKAAFSLRKMELTKAKKYLEDVLGHRRAIPFRRYSGNVGRTSQAKNEGAPAGQARWPAKSCEFLLNLLKNAESNAEVHTLTSCSSAHTWHGVLGMDRHEQRQPAIPSGCSSMSHVAWLDDRGACDGAVGGCMAAAWRWAMDVCKGSLAAGIGSRSFTQPVCYSCKEGRTLLSTIHFCCGNHEQV
eukprot:456345-Pelagomonas_calceolata.AAC.5